MERVKSGERGGSSCPDDPTADAYAYDVLVGEYENTLHVQYSRSTSS